MKVQRLRLKNYKRFHNKELDFRDPETGLAQDLIVLVGQNGSGKSSVLQAIAVLLGTATRRLSKPDQLDWPGFDLALAASAWRMPMSLEVDVEFGADELAATRDYFDRTDMSADPTKTAPAHNSVVTLRYKPELNQVHAPNVGEFFQFQGRPYAKMILRYATEGMRLFERVGDVFWYTEHRTTNSLTPIENEGQLVTFSDMNLLRRRMSDLFVFHERIQRCEYALRPGQRDLFADIERAYQTVFPLRRFEGPVPRTDMDQVLAEPWFYLFDGVHQYELGEMSGGERAIFPMLFDFANWNINNSVILIDELELHLHPPLQQGLLKALQALGTNNQFIVTTHSDAVASIVPSESMRQL